MNTNSRNLNLNESNGKNMTDQVFDVLSSIIHDSNSNLVRDNDFYNALKFIIAQNEENQRRKKNNVAWVCTAFTFMFFLFMVFMVGLFVYRLYSISGHIMRHISYDKNYDSISNLSSYYEFSNRTTK